MELSLDDCRWVVSPSASPYLELASHHLAAPSNLLKLLRKDLTATRAGLIAEQATLRWKARVKFSRADQMFFLRTALEQATDEPISLYKGARFPRGETVVDLCCGIGGDLIGLAHRGPGIGVDANAAAVEFAAANLAVYGLREFSVIHQDVQKLASLPTLWHLDPDRRSSGVRRTMVQSFEPPSGWIETLLRKAPDGAIKLAPASEAPEEWSRDAEVEWIGSRRECRQQVAWFGKLTEIPGIHRATVVSNEGRTDSVTGSPNSVTSYSERIEEYVCEPHAAVLAAKLVAPLAERFSMLQLAPRVAYLTGSTPADTQLAAFFQVLEVMPFDVKKLKAALRARNIGRLEIKARGVDVTPDRLRKQLDLRGSDELTVLIAGLREGSRAILAKRLQPER